MAKPPIVFVHGWGLDSSFWSELSARFNDHECTTLNLGYRGALQCSPPPAKSIYITHSLGTMWALENHAENMSTLISINGFHSFKSFTDSRLLRAMKTRLTKDPKSQMQSFFKAADLSINSENLNPEQLAHGLDMLAEGAESTALKTLHCPVLALAGAQDKIVPIGAAQKQWLGYDLKICENGAHALPITHTEWCVEQIKNFLN